MKEKITRERERERERDRFLRRTPAIKKIVLVSMGSNG